MNPSLRVTEAYWPHLPPALQADIGARDEEAFADIEVTSREGVRATDWGNDPADQYYVIGWVDEKTWVSVLVIHWRDITVGGQPLRVGGVGGVMTPPEHRGKGYASTLMRRAAEIICEHGTHGFLICAQERLKMYGRVGWQEVTVPTYFRQARHAGRLTFGDATHKMVYTCGDATWPPGEIDLLANPW